MFNFDESWVIPAQFFGLIALGIVVVWACISRIKLKHENQKLKEINTELAQINNGRISGNAAHDRLTRMLEDLLETNRLQAAEIRKLEKSLGENTSEKVELLKKLKKK